MLSFLFRLLALSAMLSVVCGQTPISFVQQTAMASFPARYWASVESYPRPIPSANLPNNSLILFGGTGVNGYLNDVWGSSDQGRTWVQVASNVFTPTRFPGYTIDSQARLYKIGGSDTNEVWMSTNGVAWQQQMPGSPATALPARTLPDVQVDSKDVLYVIGGSGPSAAGGSMNDVWKSSDQGRNWYASTRMPFSQPPGRESGFLIHATSRQTKQDVLTYMGGYSRVGNNLSTVAYHNDIYMSTDAGLKWLLVTANAPWSKRDNFNAEVTRDGAIVLVAGYSDATRELNDVWVSMDGGWTWGLCIEDSPWSDRRWVSTVLDRDGYLFMIGGDERNNATGERIPHNDVWRSNFTLFDNIALSKACGVDIPSCGVGLTCTPGNNTRIVNGRVTCPAIVACSTDNLAFNVITAHAPWSARHSPGVEFLKKVVTIGGVRYSPPNSMVLWGGTGPGEALLNDVFISSNGGLNWEQVPQTGAGFPGSAWSGHIIDSQSRIFKIGGERWGNPDNTGNGEVYMSINAGVSWTQQRNTTRTSGLPPRAFADTYVDASDNIYVAAGLQVGGPGLNDIWMSSDQGRNWKRQGGIPVGSPPGRSSASLLIQRSPVLQKDIMYYFGGFSRGGPQPALYHNDVWASSDLGRTWKQITDRAPWIERDNFNAEITKEGLIVFAGGFNSRGALNDVWVSADGGFSWTQCVAEAQFSDRRWHATAMDNNGFLYLLGGEEREDGVDVKQNDVWRSSISFSTSTAANKLRLTKACGLTYPACTAGLSCWPGTQTRDARTGQITCALYRKYQSLGCSTVDPNDPSTWGSSGDWSESSTGLPTPSSGMSVGLIALIVVLVGAGVAGIVGYFYYVKKQQSAQPIIPGVGTDGLLLSSGRTTDSTSEGASGSDYYAQSTGNTA